MTATRIEWTDEVWNPISGCSKVSAGCKHCYAERVFPRVYGRDVITAGPGLAGLTGAPMHGVASRPRRFTDIKLHSDRLAAPLRWKKPRRVFVNSMSDLFHEDVPDEFIDQVFAVMALAPQHTFQVLTKRPKRMLEYMLRCKSELHHLDNFPRGPLASAFREASRARGDKLPGNAPLLLLDGRWPLPNVWLGVSVEDQATADERIPLLLQTPAAVRWISAEPLLGPIHLLRPDFSDNGHGRGWIGKDDGSAARGPTIDWIVAGGESGPRARPAHPYWFRALRNQCKAARVPFFFKQWGEWAPIGPVYPHEFGLSEDMTDDYDIAEFPRAGVMYADGTFYDGIEWQPHIGACAYWMERKGKRNAGRELDGRTWDEFPT